LPIDVIGLAYSESNIVKADLIGLQP